MKGNIYKNENNNTNGNKNMNWKKNKGNKNTNGNSKNLIFSLVKTNKGSKNYVTENVLALNCLL